MENSDTFDQTEFFETMLHNFLTLLFRYFHVISTAKSQ